MMDVKLIAYTQPDSYFLEKNPQLKDAMDLVGYCARVSNPDSQMKMMDTERLIDYLVRHKHWSPFEMVSATLEINTTRDIARQMLRHRSFSFQEFSQRYADVHSMGGPVFTTREARLQDTKNRQNSIESYDPDLEFAWREKQLEVITVAKKAYDWALEHHIAKEQARAVLPEGNTVSRLYMSGTIRSWIHYIDLRSSNGTQREHMAIAREVGRAISKIFPLAKGFIHEQDD